MLLSRNVDVSEWRCVGMALCPNVVVNDKMSGVERTDDRQSMGLLFTFVINSLTLLWSSKTPPQNLKNKSKNSLAENIIGHNFLWHLKEILKVHDW